MNKKRLTISVLILCIIIATVVLLIVNLNKNNDKINNSGKNQEENYKEYTTAEWKEYANNYYVETTGDLPVDIKLYSDGSDVMIIEIYDNAEGINYVEKYTVDYKTGIGTDIQGNEVNLNLK